jgi:phage shock protein A
MSFFGRIKDWFSATAHDTMDKVEDPEKMANEYLRQLNDQYYQAKTQVAQAMADETRLEQKMLEAQNEVEKFQGMAETALRSSKEDLARQALQRKTQAQRMATQYEQQFQAQSEQVDNLQKSLADLETKIGETKARRDLIVAKKNRAQTQEAIQSAVGSLGSGMSATDKFDSLEDKIDDRLAKAEAAAELESSSLENQFRDLEAESGVDSEMEELKRKMGMA